MGKSLLILGRGDTAYADRNAKRLFNLAKKKSFDVCLADYDQIKRLPGFENENLNIMLFFPCKFWNTYCEVPDDTLLYGTSKKAYDLFRNFFMEIKTELEQKFNNHQLHYVIPPEKAFIDRDKIKTIELLRARGVPTTEIINYSCLEDVLDRVGDEKGVFIKCRYGAEGKGITSLRKNKWVTNYKVENNMLANYGVHDRWPFTDITGKKHLLKQLLEHEVIVESEIITPNILFGQKFDVRGYSINYQTPHLFARINAHDRIITNFSQGATVLHHPETGLPEKCIHLVKEITPKAAEAMGLRFAGVDMMFDEHPTNCKVVEVQAFTDFPDINKFNLAEYIIENNDFLV